MSMGNDDRLRQEPHVTSGTPDNALEVAIGRQVRGFRHEQNLTIAELAREARLSSGMLSKIENGQTLPSLSTLRSVANALNVPVTALFREYEEERDAVFVKAGHGLTIERRGTRAGHQYQLLGHSPGGSIVVESYLITLREGPELYLGAVRCAELSDFS